MQLLGYHVAISQADERGGVDDPALGKDVMLLHKAGLNILRPGHDSGAGDGIHHVSMKNGG